MLYHTSCDKNLKDCEFHAWNGTFGEFVFFSSNVYQMSDAATSIYAIDDESLSIVAARELYHEIDTEDSNKFENQLELLREAAEILESDIETALEVLSERRDVHITDSEKSWELQSLTAQIAKSLGYDGVQVNDEQGVAWMIDMKRNKALLQAA